jgi:hypothetical protein
MKGKPRRGGERNDRPAAKLKSVEVTVDRGRDFVIVKRTEFDATTHRPLSVRYTLTREGLPQPRSYSRLSEAREDSTKPIEELMPPEPPAPEPAAPEPVTAEAEAATAAEPTAPAAGGPAEVPSGA